MKHETREPQHHFAAEFNFKQARHISKKKLTLESADRSGRYHHHHIVIIIITAYTTAAAAT